MRRAALPGAITLLVSACGSGSGAGAPPPLSDDGGGATLEAGAGGEGSAGPGGSDGATANGGMDGGMNSGSKPGADAGGPADATAQGDVTVGTPRDAMGPPAEAGEGGGRGGVYAFPEALGFGRTATGGRGGAVVHVTNLNDSGPGSFRDAVSAGGRTVVFDVGGYVTLTSPLSVSSNVTIAGQTAPGDGFGVKGNEVSFSGRTNAVVRYVRFRQGCATCTRSDPDFKRSGINLASSSLMIFDHVSIEFAQWNNIDAVGASNVTFQNSIDADPIGQQFAAHTEGGPFTWFGNLFANAHNRCPLAKANTQFVNNVVYDYQAGYTAGNTAGSFSSDVVGSYFIAGPSTTSPGNAFFQVNNQPIFNSGNLLDANADGTLNGAALANPGGAVVLGAAWSPATASLPARSADAAYAAIVASAGASIHRDEVDAQVVSDVVSLGKAGHLWTSPVQTGLANGGFGTLGSGPAPADTDGDGMPDAWERRYGLDPNSAADGNGDFDHTGYTNVEKYIDGLADGSYPTM